MEAPKLYRNICLATCSAQSLSNNSEWSTNQQRSANLEDALPLIKLISPRPKGSFMTLPLGTLDCGGPPRVPRTKFSWLELPDVLMFSCLLLLASDIHHFCRQRKGKQRQPLFCNFAVFFALLITLSQKKYVSKLLHTNPIIAQH